MGSAWAGRSRTDPHIGLANAKVDVIFAEFEIAARAGKDAADRIPLVFSAVGDPGATGLVKTIAHPGANVTGVSGLTTELALKRLEWLKAVQDRESVTGLPGGPRASAMIC